jgi:hypothetical protein
VVTIDPVYQLVAVIRQQVATVRGESPARNAVSGTKATAPRTGRQSVAEVISRRVRAIDPDEPGSRRKAFRIFLESVLLGEFGTDLINDPAFYRLVDDVHNMMESDAELRPRLEEAGRLLLERRPAS